MQHPKRTHRITFYLNDPEVGHLDNATAEADMERADYLRAMLMGDVASTEEGSAVGVMRNHSRRHTRASTGLSNFYFKARGSLAI